MGRLETKDIPQGDLTMKCSRRNGRRGWVVGISGDDVRQCPVRGLIRRDDGWAEPSEDEFKKRMEAQDEKLESAYKRSMYKYMESILKEKW